MSKASAPEKAPWRIGELAEQTGVSTRSLRHYENQGLIIAQRSSTGQRMFSASAAQQVRHIRMLLDAGLPTRVIAELMDCIRDPGRLDPCAVPTLVEHLQDYDRRLAELETTRVTLQGLIDSSQPG